MKELTTIEKKALIAKFLGAVKMNLYHNEYEMYGVIECVEDGEDEQHFFTPEQMKFDSDWNWIMPVIQEIENKTEWVLVMASGYAYFVKDGVEHEIGETGGWQDIEDICKIVVEFIEWYNCKI